MQNQEIMKNQDDKQKQELSLEEWMKEDQHEDWV